MSSMITGFSSPQRIGLVPLNQVITGAGDPVLAQHRLVMNVVGNVAVCATNVVIFGGTALE